MSARATTDRIARLALLVAVVAMFAYLVQRNYGLNPAIFSDEWYYSKMSRLMPLREVPVPSYLYLWVFSASNACGDGFLDCVRVGNAAFFVAGAGLVYATARRFLEPALALAAALVSLLMPLNLSTALFMPESMYYFGFCVLSWIALTRTGWRWLAYSATLGAVLGLMTLVKVHALFLLPALCLFALIVRKGGITQGPWLGPALLSTAVVALVALGLKFGLGYAVAGKSGLAPFGALYGDVANSVRRPLAALFAPALVNAGGHAMALAVLLALPLALSVQLLASRAARRRAPPALVMLALYALLMLLAAVGMTIAFTASIAVLGPVEMLRLHLRYYSFVFPLLCIVALAAVRGGGDAGDAGIRAATGAVLGALLLLALFELPRYALTMHDGPEIAALNFKDATGRGIVLLELAAVLLWAAGHRAAAPLYACATLPLLAAIGLHANFAYLRQLVPAWAADRAGRFAHQYIPAPERKLTVVAGTGVHETVRVQFHIDDKDISLIDLPKDAPIRAYQLPSQAKWLLVVGHHPLPDGLQPVAGTAEYSLIRLPANQQMRARAALSAPFGDGLIAAAEGLAAPEPWGRWSDGRRVVLHLSTPLPRRATVILTARAFGPNTRLPFTLSAASSSAQFMLGSALEPVALHLDTDGSARTLAIDIPRPTAPAELFQGDDNRKLGIGIAGIEIDAASEAVLSSK